MRNKSMFSIITLGKTYNRTLIQSLVLDFAQTWKDDSEHRCSSALVFLCYAQWGSTPRPRSALRWVGSVGRSMSVCVREAAMKGVKIPSCSKINPLSHGLTFTEAWSVGVCEGVALLCVCVCVCVRFPSTKEKSSIDISWCSCPCVKCRPGSEGNWEFPQVYSCQCACVCVCLHVSHVCIERHDVLKCVIHA